MDSLVEAFINFVKVRQINFAIVAVLTCGYFVYQYWEFLSEMLNDKCGRLNAHSAHRVGSDHSRSRSRSRSGHREESKQGRSRRYGRCPDCSRCNLED